jgi:hypothetical protein
MTRSRRDMRHPQAETLALQGRGSSIARAASTVLAQAAGIERSKVAELAPVAERNGSGSGFLNTDAITRQ